MIRDAEIYLPVSVTNVGEDRLINYLVDGYAFIRRAHPDEKYYKLEGSRYVQAVITKVERLNGRAVRKIACATDADIDRFKSQIHDKEDQGIGVGDTVLVTSGPYRQIRAQVIEDIPETESVQIHVKLRSKESIVTLPRSFLRLVEKAPRTSFLPRIAALRAWLAKAQTVAVFDDAPLSPIRERLQAVSRFNMWIPKGLGLNAEIRMGQTPAFDVRPIAKAFAKVYRLHSWHERGNDLVNHLRAIEKPMDHTPVRERFLSFERLHHWAERLREMAPLFVPTAKLATIEGAYLKWQWFDGILDRLAVLREEVDQIESTFLGGNITENLIVDGHQLAIRCALSPGLSELKDSRGRPTGGIVGFLRSLGGFTKKFPGATITVVWDGSSQRRRKQYDGYKANRTQLRAFFEIEYLKELLPLLGITQATNPEEEADDIIATLVRGQYQGQQNVMVTTDRDFLQLVTGTDRQFVPAVGFGKEKTYDTALVEKEYGVKPERMVHYRAIDGDSSDNIPGVPGFGPKMASKLVALYGTVDGIFSSSLAGLTPLQYQKLRAAEKQVKLNVQLMTLLTNIPVTITAPNPDPTAATERLQNVDVKVESILPVFFPAGGGA